ncbi:MAG: hypothetical protein AAFY57_11100 [Cyanobacteria bacterium J06642_2]
MERGLLWLPLLGIFLTLASWGWRAYLQVETYREWAKDFDTAKYDAAAVLGLKGNEIAWGKPSRHGPKNVKRRSLADINEIQLRIGDRAFTWPPEELPEKGRRIALELLPEEEAIAFTDLRMAIAWWKKLQTSLKN